MFELRIPAIEISPDLLQVYLCPPPPALHGQDAMLVFMPPDNNVTHVNIITTIMTALSPSHTRIVGGSYMTLLEDWSLLLCVSI